jgi:hypothetical protein
MRRFYPPSESPRKSRHFRSSHPSFLSSLTPAGKLQDLRGSASNSRAHSDNHFLDHRQDKKGLSRFGCRRRSGDLIWEGGAAGSICKLFPLGNDADGWKPLASGLKVTVE